ncbi:MAG: hypothetical protein NC115_08245 [Bacteroidales bacterium]|nr:hypothetical protein [Bacteroidales bacterium]
MTRAGEDWEDDFNNWWDDWFNENIYGNDEWDYGNHEYTNLGDGYYMDSDGDIYWDSDGNGEPDTFFLEGGFCTSPDDGEGQGENQDPDPGPGPDGGTGWENEWGEGYLYVPDNNYNEDLERGKKGVKKMQDDLKEGKVDFYKVADGMLTGFGVGANANGIILSASNFLSGIGSDTKALEAFGKSLGWAGIAITGTQTIIILRTEGELSTGDWLSLISAALSGCAIITIEFPILSGTLGITSGILGLISIFVSENYPSGIYEIIAPNGEKAYIYIGNNLLTA